MPDRDVLTEKDLLKKPVEETRFQYPPLDKELKAQTNIAKKQYQKLDDTFKFNKIILKKTNTKKL